MSDRWYQLNKLPDLSLNVYSSLDGSGVDGVLEKHISLLRQLNRKGIMSGLSFHLFYLYVSSKDNENDTPGQRLKAFLHVRGVEDNDVVDALIKASPLASFFKFSDHIVDKDGTILTCSIENVSKVNGFTNPSFDVCSVLSKTESYLSSDDGESSDYYIIREWEINSSARLYNMFKVMEMINQTVLYRVDLYPVERNDSLRDSLRKPMSILRKRQDNSIGTRRDYEGQTVLETYEKIIENFDSSPHFITNIMVFANSKDTAVSILDAAGSEALIKGKYTISSFKDSFDSLSFLNGDVNNLYSVKDKMIAYKSNPGFVVCKESSEKININYLPTLFTLEEIAPFFRFPALYDGEVIQLPKETTPAIISSENALYLGKDMNGYDVNIPLSLLSKHAFIAGVPGSGKTNLMHHMTSSLYKQGINFLVLEPAKQEYRALLNDEEMSGVYLFSPNADMSFPLHINPFEMPKGIMVAEHIRRLCSVFEGAFPLEPPMPFLLDTAIEAVYRELGWIPEHIYTGEEGLSLPTMSMLYERLEEEVKSTSYSGEVRGNLESALKVRIGSLLRREMGDVFDVDKSTFTPEKWLEVSAIIELESMGSGPANFLTLMLCSLIRETLKVNPLFDGDLRHVIFIEEAHNLIGPESEETTGFDANPKIAATAFIVKMLAEVRALKEGIVIADQLPSVMAQEVLKNTGLKVGLRITSSDDRYLLGGTMSASAVQLEQMATYSVGESLVFYEKLLKPFKMKINEWFGYVEDKELKAKLVSSKNDKDLREALRNNDAYNMANIMSVNIICRKYYKMFSRMESRISNCIEWLTSISKGNEKIAQLNDYFMKVEMNDIKVDEASLNEIYDQRELLVRKVHEAQSDASEKAMMLSIVDQLSQIIQSLERLKNGRWKRGNVTEDYLMRVSLFQSQMCDYLLQVGKLMSEIFEIEDAKEKELIQISELASQLYSGIRTYIEVNGKDSILSSGGKNG